MFNSNRDFCEISVTIHLNWQVSCLKKEKIGTQCMNFLENMKKPTQENTQIFCVSTMLLGLNICRSNHANNKSWWLVSSQPNVSSVLKTQPNQNSLIFMFGFYQKFWFCEFGILIHLIRKVFTGKNELFQGGKLHSNQSLFKLNQMFWKWANPFECINSMNLIIFPANRWCFRTKT